MDRRVIAGIETERLIGLLSGLEREKAPALLFTAGEVELLRAASRVAVIGSRKATTAGLKRAVRLSSELARAQVIVVSGLAEGIDTAAHGASIEAGGRTIAVLGTPLDQYAPKQNEFLQKKIAREHLALSLFAPGSAVLRSNFPLRNLLMALVSHATVIVEAQDGSGTLHQAKECLRLGRPLFLMRSILDDKSLTWPQPLLERGALVLTETAQVIDVLPRASQSRDA